MYDILKETIEEELESKENFKTCPYYAPMVWKWKIITYQINGLEFQAKSLMASGRVGIKAMTLEEWFNSKGLEEVTNKTVTKAMEHAKIYAINRTVDGKLTSSTHAFLCENQSKDSIAYKCYEAIKEKKQLLSSYTKLTSELIDKVGVTEKEYLRSYLFCHTSSSVKYEPNNNYDDDSHQIVKENIAYRLLEVYHDLVSDLSVENAEDIGEYVQHLCENYGVSSCQIPEIIKTVINQHKLWNSLSYKEIMELISVLGEDELEDIVIGDVKGK